MSIPLPSPSLFPKKPSTIEAPQPESSTPSSEAKAAAGSNEVPKKPFVRKPHLTQNLREDGVLKGVMAELRESEEINRRAGWYDRNRNGKQRQNKKPQRKR